MTNNNQALAVTPEDIQQAAARVRGMAHRTPVLTSRSFNAEAGVEAFFKCENFQRGGAFKIRGASNFVFSLTDDERRRGVVACSSGYRALAGAIAAVQAGGDATLVMPDDAPRLKVAATRAHGARIVSYNRFAESREEIGRRIARETGATLIPPYDHPLTIAGQGTVALEFLEQAPDLDALVICVGGGGLIAGCAVAAKSLKPGIGIFGVEPERANDTYLSFQAGRRVEAPNPDTIADGLRSPRPGELTFPVVQRHVENIVLVTEEEIRQTVRYLLLRMKILAEPSGAVAAAAVLHHKLPPAIKRPGIVVSGGNVDFETLASFA